MTIEKHEAEVLRHLASVLETSETRLYEQVASSFRWLMATLFAANGGAIIGILGSETIAAKVGTNSLIFFAVGMVCSILMSVIGSLYAAVAAKPLNDLRTLLVMSLASGELAPSDVESKMGAMNRSMSLRWPLYFFEAASIGSLIAGLVAVGITLSA